MNRRSKRQGRLSERPAGGPADLLARLDEEVQVGRADLLVLDHDDEPLDDVHQLADVPRPWVVEEGLLGLRAHGLGLLAVFGRVEVQEMVDEERDVLRPLAERRDVHRDDVQLEEEVLAEACPRLTRSLRFLARRGDDAGVEGDGVAAPSGSNSPLDQGPDELGLRPEVHVPDLVQEQGARRRRGGACPSCPSGRGARAPLIEPKSSCLDDARRGWRRS